MLKQYIFLLLFLGNISSNNLLASEPYRSIRIEKGKIRYIYPLPTEDKPYATDPVEFETRFKTVLNMNIELLSKENVSQQDMQLYETSLLKVLEHHKRTIERKQPL